MEKQEFLDKMGRFIEGPEHNAYYDVLDILEICLVIMTDNQREDAYRQMVDKRKLTDMVAEAKKKPPAKIKPVFTPHEAEIIICLLDQEAKRVKSQDKQNLLRIIIAKIQTTEGYQKMFVEAKS